MYAYTPSHITRNRLCGKKNCVNDKALLCTTHKIIMGVRESGQTEGINLRRSVWEIRKSTDKREVHKTHFFLFFFFHIQKKRKNCLKSEHKDNEK